MPDDRCACGLKYKTGCQVMAGVNMVLGSILIIAGFVMIDVFYSYGATWVSWCVAIGGCFFVTTGCQLSFGVEQRKPKLLGACVGLSWLNMLLYAIISVFAICNGMGTKHVVTLTMIVVWIGFTIVSVNKYMKLMLTPRRTVFETPYVSGGHPGAPARVVISPDVQPGVYPAPYIPGPLETFPDNTNTSNPYPSDNPPPPYSEVVQPPPPPYSEVIKFSQPPDFALVNMPPPLVESDDAGLVHSKSSSDVPGNSP